MPVSTRVPGTFAELKNGDAVMLVVNSGITLEGSDLHSRHSAKLRSGCEHTAPGIEAFAQLAAAGLTLRLRLGVSAWPIEVRVPAKLVGIEDRRWAVCLNPIECRDRRRNFGETADQKERGQHGDRKQWHEGRGADERPLELRLE